MAFKNKRDLYEKIHAELPGVTVAEFLSAFVKINMSGIAVKVHDNFHPSEDPVAAH